MSQPFGLGGLGHAVLVHPSLVTAALVMEVQPADHGRNFVGGVAVGGQAPVAAVETGPPVQATVAAGKDVLVVVAFKVGAEQIDDERREQDVPPGGQGLRRAEGQLTANLVEIAVVGIDEDPAVVELAVRPA